MLYYIQVITLPHILLRAKIWLPYHQLPNQLDKDADSKEVGRAQAKKKKKDRKVILMSVFCFLMASLGQ